jgi:hypothetical protein
MQSDCFCQEIFREFMEFFRCFFIICGKYMFDILTAANPKLSILTALLFDEDIRLNSAEASVESCQSMPKPPPNSTLKTKNLP